MNFQNPNGRVNFTPSNNPFMFMDKIPVNDKTTNYRDALNGTFESSKLSCAYFSADNINNIQQLIKSQIKKNTNKVIGDQNLSELKIIMRSIFLQYSKNNPENINEQLNFLNSVVVNECVRKIQSEIFAYQNYMRDITYLPVPHDNPVLSNIKDKTLELKPWF